MHLRINTFQFNSSLQDSKAHILIKVSQGYPWSDGVLTALCFRLSRKWKPCCTVFCVCVCVKLNLDKSALKLWWIEINLPAWYNNLRSKDSYDRISFSLGFSVKLRLRFQPTTTNWHRHMPDTVCKSERKNRCRISGFKMITTKTLTQQKPWQAWYYIEPLKGYSAKTWCWTVYWNMRWSASQIMNQKRSSQHFTVFWILQEDLKIDHVGMPCN